MAYAEVQERIEGWFGKVLNTARKTLRRVRDIQNQIEDGAVTNLRRAGRWARRKPLPALQPVPVNDPRYRG
jgi:hypothetical protein